MCNVFVFVFMVEHPIITQFPDSYFSDNNHNFSKPEILRLFVTDVKRAKATVKWPSTVKRTQKNILELIILLPRKQ